MNKQRKEDIGLQFFLFLPQPHSTTEERNKGGRKGGRDSILYEFHFYLF